MKIKALATEAINPKTINIDKASTSEIIEMFYEEDKLVADAVYAQKERIEEVIEAINIQYGAGGRIIYVGAGNSGRLGMCDATECPPTFNVSPERVVAVVAGGEKSLSSAIESIEDDGVQAIKDLEKLKINNKDVIIGLSASGRTPYVKAALAQYPSNLTIAISCSPNSEISSLAKLSLEIEVGPEVICGSTRLKAGTAQKMILNMISTSVFIKQGYVKQNRMINVRITNEKLQARAITILEDLFGISKEHAIKLLTENDLDMRKTIKTIEEQL